MTEIFEAIMRFLKELMGTVERTKVPISIEEAKCLTEAKCGKCNMACPVVRLGVVKSIRDGPVRLTCIKCQACQTVCPMQAIEVEGTPPLRPLSHNLPSFDQIMAALEERRSTRFFISGELTKEQKEKLTRAVRSSPIGHNNDYIGTIFVTRKDLLEALTRVCMDRWGLMTQFINLPVTNLLFKKLLGQLTYDLFSELARYYPEERAYYEAGGDPICFNGSVILITALKGETMGVFEAGLATMSLMLCAESLDLGTCLNGILMAMQGEVKKVLGLSKDIDICGAVVIGQPALKRYGVPQRKERPVVHM